MVIFRKRAAGLSEPALERFVARAKRAIRMRGMVNVLVTTSRELRILNRRFRGQDRATDVLSFSPILGVGVDFAGDVAISGDMAAQNARRLGHAVADEIRILALHGMLHLAGYDHERDSGAMARKEMLLRRRLGLPLGLIERSAGSSGDRQPLGPEFNPPSPTGDRRTRPRLGKSRGRQSARPKSRRSR